MFKPKTNLDRLIRSRGLSQGDLLRLIRANSGYIIGRDRISRICTGDVTNFSVKTARLISDALQVSIDSIVDIKNITKKGWDRDKKLKAELKRINKELKKKK